MIFTSTLIMYFLMFINVYESGHVIFSQTRLFMAIIMGSLMSVVMLLFMWKIYDDRKMNIIIMISSMLLFLMSLYLVRSQSTVDEVSWMRAMIPHHSSAILTSERAQLEYPRVRMLAEEIIEAQKREIDEMEKLIEELR